MREGGDLRGVKFVGGEFSRWKSMDGTECRNERWDVEAWIMLGGEGDELSAGVPA